MARALITGGAGFVGRWFTNELLQLGWSVSVVDNFVASGGGRRPEQWGPLHLGIKTERFELIEDDCRNYFSARRSNQEWDLVIHLAAVVGGRRVIEQDPLAVAEDLAIDSDFWRWASKVPIDSIAHFSSSAAYPIEVQQRGSEGSRLAEGDIDFTRSLGMPDLSYGWAKLTSEYLGHLFAKAKPTKVVTFRPFSGYGPDQDHAYPFPSIMRRALDYANGIEPEMYVWGSGLQARDFIHIQDVTRLALIAMKRLPTGSVINLGTGIRTTFIELAQTALEALAVSTAVSSQSNEPEGVFSRVADTALMSKFGLYPEISLKSGVAEALEYLRS